MGCNCSNEYKRSNIIETSKKNADFKKKFEYISSIGDGSFGKVKLYRDRIVHDMKFAIKIINKAEMSLDLIECLKQEVEVLKKLDHPNIVKYFNTYEDKGSIKIVMEYIPGENLMQVISQKKINKYDEEGATEIIKSLLKAVIFLHRSNIIHRDIKPENILFSTSGLFESLKLIDFGLSINEEDKISRTQAGSPNFMAPETWDKKYTKKSDSWSIGVVLYLLLTNKLPFIASDKINLINKIKSGDYDKKMLNNAPISQEAKRLISSLLILEEKKRLSVEDVLKSPWIKKFEKSEEHNKKMILNFFHNNNIVENFRQFEKYSNFKKEILFSMAKLSQDCEVRQLKKIFNEFDKDNSGSIEKDEIKLIFTNLGISSNEKELEMMWKSLDFHRDGTVNYTEFLAASLSSSYFLQEDKLMFIFKFFDENNDDYISPKLIINVLKMNNIPVEENEVLKIFDGDENRKVHFEQFRKLMN